MEMSGIQGGSFVSKKLDSLNSDGSKIGGFKISIPGVDDKPNSPNSQRDEMNEIFPPGERMTGLSVGAEVLRDVHWEFK
jgi:hypothetical protein